MIMEERVVAILDILQVQILCSGWTFYRCSQAGNRNDVASGITGALRGSFVGWRVLPTWRQYLNLMQAAEIV